MRPRLLDLFAGVGGAAVGYQRAGFEVVGVDIHRQPNYPLTFVPADALAVLVNVIAGKAGLVPFDAIHASPPCQASSNLTRGTNRETKSQNHTNLIPVVRELLKLTGLPWVIENVQGAHMRRDLTLCGEMFGLDVIRHRYFEVSGFDVQQPTHVKHRGRVRGWRHGQYFDGPYVAVYGDGGGKGTVKEWQDAMGIDWTDQRRNSRSHTAGLFGVRRPATHGADRNKAGSVTAFTDGLVLTGYGVYLLRAALGVVFNAERFEGNR